MSISKIVASAALAAGLMIVGVNGALADDTTPPNGPMMANEQMDADKASKRLQQKLNLTDEKTVEIRKIMEDTHEKGEQIRKQMQALKEETDAKFKAVLSPEEYAKWKDIRESRHQRMKKGS